MIMWSFWVNLLIIFTVNVTPPDPPDPISAFFHGWAGIFYREYVLRSYSGSVLGGGPSRSGAAGRRAYSGWVLEEPSMGFG